MKHAKKLLYQFLTKKATTHDTHGICKLPVLWRKNLQFFMLFANIGEKDPLRQEGQHTARGPHPAREG